MKSAFVTFDASPFARFLLSGSIAAGVNILKRIALSEVVRYELAVVLAYLAGMPTAYVLMRLFVFEASGRSMRSELWRFVLVNALALAQAWLVSVGLARWWFPVAVLTFHAEAMARIFGASSTPRTIYLGHQCL